MTVSPVIVYVVVCLVVGWLGDGSRFGFWGSFLGALFLSPLLAMMVLLLAVRLEGSGSRADRAYDDDED